MKSDERKRALEMLDFAIKRSSDVVVGFNYESRNGAITRRVVSPYRMSTPSTFEGLCLTRQEARQFNVDLMSELQIGLAFDFVAPFPEMILRPCSSEYVSKK